MSEYNHDDADCVEEMPETKEGFLAWVKSHKKQLIIAGISVGTLIAVILGIKHKDSIKALWTPLTESINVVPTKVPNVISTAPTTPTTIEVTIPTRAYTPPTESFEVCGHIRTLPSGCHHSAEKAAEAAALGLELLENQTFVSPYTKGVA